MYAAVPVTHRRERAKELLQAFGMGRRSDHRPAELSGGEQQRVAIARALMNGGRVILADEPTGALDSEQGEAIMALLTDLADRGHTVVVVSHDPAVAARARRRVELRDGRVVEDSGPMAPDASLAPPMPTHHPGPARLLRGHCVGVPRGRVIAARPSAALCLERSQHSARHRLGNGPLEPGGRRLSRPGPGGGSDGSRQNLAWEPHRLG